MELNRSTVAAIIVGIVVTLGLGYFIYQSLTSAKLGTEIPDMGREHVTDIYGISYNSNPPTSGPHFPLWAKRGYYDQLISDGYLIHSLEHGYIVLSYNCRESGLGLVRSAYAHEEPTKESTDSGELLMHMRLAVGEGMSFFTPENPPEVEVELPESFDTPDCKRLVEELQPFLTTAERVILVPRPTMDTPIALTAWGRLLRLDNVDKDQIEAFIKAYHNRGPEATLE